ncbi:MAG: hypothetical protein HF977_01430 [ANME-2 cluster archaeon]|nr:hypothetical protein [ANME-2 cluster archaeon]
MFKKKIYFQNLPAESEIYRNVNSSVDLSMDIKNNIVKILKGDENVQVNLEETLSTTFFKSRLDIIKNNSEDLFRQGVLHHKYFTIHGIAHSHAIISNLNDLVGGIEPNNDLTEHEIFYLLASVYLHDVGMLVSYPNDEGTAKVISTHEMPFTKEGKHQIIM